MKMTREEFENTGFKKSMKIKYFGELLFDLITVDFERGLIGIDFYGDLLQVFYFNCEIICNKESSTISTQKSDTGFVKGVCCAYCKHFEKESCPIKEASPWSRWKNYCSEYILDTDNPLDSDGC